MVEALMTQALGHVTAVRIDARAPAFAKPAPELQLRCRLGISSAVPAGDCKACAGATATGQRRRSMAPGTDGATRRVEKHMELAAIRWSKYSPGTAAIAVGSTHRRRAGRQNRALGHTPIGCVVRASLRAVSSAPVLHSVIARDGRRPTCGIGASGLSP